MIRTIFRVSWFSLRRDRMALLLTFGMPLAFFSVFAWVFGSLDRAIPNPVAVALLCEDQADCETILRGRLRSNPSIQLLEETVASRDRARELVRRGRVGAAVIVPEGFTENARDLQDHVPQVELLADTSNPLTVSVVRGVLVAELGDVLLERLQHAGAIPADRAAGGLLGFQVEDVLGGGGKRPSVAFFAAGIGVMFLLFAVSGRAAILIEERESGLLDRLLATNTRLGHYLVGRWAFLAALGSLQVILMFLWASVAFGLDLWSLPRFSGFLIMTLVTSGAAAGFGLVLSASCSSRAQLNGVAVVAVLVMSALGGSMFPRFLMPAELQKLGLLTFNAWALDGYHKVFWYQMSPISLWPQVVVLLGLTLLFLGIARWSAGRRLAT